jgi:hypothetical protein
VRDGHRRAREPRADAPEDVCYDLADCAALASFCCAS